MLNAEIKVLKDMLSAPLPTTGALMTYIQIETNEIPMSTPNSRRYTGQLE